MGSAEGGVEIEQVAVDDPEAIIRRHADPMLGLLDFQAREFAFAMGLGGHLKAAVAHRQGPRPDDARLRRRPRRDQPAGDRPRDRRRTATPVERLVCLDAKVTLDDSALARHPELEELRDPDEEDPADREAREAGPDVHQARRHDRLHGQRRRPGDDDDGPRQARRRRAGQLPRHRRRRPGRQGRGGDAAHPRRPEGRRHPRQHLRRHHPRRRGRPRPDRGARASRSATCRWSSGSSAPTPPRRPVLLEEAHFETAASLDEAAAKAVAASAARAAAA